VEKSNVARVAEKVTECSHTPGPWVIGDRAKAENPLMVYCDDSLGSRVADCSTSGHGISHDRDYANARLIAAAPTMFDYVKNRAALGCSEAQKLLESIHASR
jgi:hypothetical protein